MLALSLPAAGARKKAVQRNLRLSPLLLRQFPPTGLTPAAVPGRPAAPVERREAPRKGRTEAREKAGGSLRMGYPKRGFPPVFSRASALPLLCPGTRLTTSAKLAEIACFTVRSWFARKGVQRGFERPENLPLGWFSARSGPEGPGSKRALWRRARERGALERSPYSS